ncbi:MAG: tetratricopeptide repeat protein [Candidatus Riflebacteria bacterium]|nr:tetratricopeptide repeat protein [Candidatus Riflebacteria bacterium]
MKKLLILLLIALLPCTLAAQVQLFQNSLQPATSDLLPILATLNSAGNALDNEIEKLRKVAYNRGATDAQKTDLAAFLLRKIRLCIDLPYEANEDMILEVADLVPGNFYMESLWGDLLYFKGDYEKALEHYETALYKSPEDMQTVSKVGLTSMQLMNYAKAIEHLDKSLAANPESFFLLFYLGKCHFELRQLDEAINYWEKALIATDDKNQKAAVSNSINQAREMLASTGDSTSDEDQRFIIHFAGESQQDLSDITFEVLEEIFYQVTDSLNYRPDVKINVIFFLTEDYYKVSRDWSAASAQGIKIMIPLKSGYKSPDYIRGLLAHEFTHTIVHLHTNNRCPLWLNEGLAQYQEFAAENGSPEEIRSDYQGMMQREFIDQENSIDLNQVPNLMNGSSRNDVARAYIASYLATRCIADFYGEQSFDTILSALGRGKTIDEAMVEGTGNNMKEFQREYKSWLRNL